MSPASRPATRLMLPPAPEQPGGSSSGGIAWTKRERLKAELAGPKWDFPLRYLLDDTALGLVQVEQPIAHAHRLRARQKWSLLTIKGWTWRSRISGRSLVALI